MLEINIVDKDKAGEFSSRTTHAYFFFMPKEDEEKELSKSYVSVKPGYITAGNKNVNEVLFVYNFGKIELFTFGFYNVKRREWSDKEERLVQEVNNLSSAKEWVASGKALFSLGVALFYIDSINSVVTVCAPLRYGVKFGNLDAFVIL